MVHIVGAGCGAADLITLRGKRLIEEADVLIYAGSLVNPELLSYAREGCELHDSAKMTLEEIFEVIGEAEKAGKTTVRLHSGDPSLYGAIGEQMRAFDERGIAYDITPGVSAFAGAAAALKTEYTLPGVTQSVIITRAAGKTSVPEAENLASLASHGTTMVLFLSAGLLDRVTKELTEGGLSPDTPAAIVCRASWPDETICRCTVGTLEAAARENGITKTALIVVGGVLDSAFERSRLYDPNFATEFRGIRDGGKSE
ncbi:MAG: precorrin-4 C(11)-methyltransferase [Ruminococcaceae bacterium]|jgi:precorrin-4/cobalt-precorrin-4 C11-methyltransferase|nr:precorrin-4 C(11)-methyltransferase [Oscillospiraceae bacterium]